MAQFILLGWFAMTLISTVFGAVVYLFDIDMYAISGELDISGFALYFTAIVVAPLIETLLCQKLPYWALSKIPFFKRNIWYIYLIPALIFGSLHYYSIAYMIFTFFFGLLFIYGYGIRQGKSPYWTITIIHALHNLTVMMTTFLPE